MSRTANRARWRDVSRALASIAIVIGAAVMGSWLVGATPSNAFASEFGIMKANGAVAFILLGISLLFFPSDEGAARRWRASRIAAGMVLALAVLTGFQYVYGVNLGIDELIARDPTGSPPGRPATGSVLMLGLSSLAILLVGTPRAAARSAGQVIASGTLLIGLAVLIAYAFDLNPQRNLPASSISAHSALTFVLVSLAALLARPDAMPMAVFLSDLPSARLARVLVVGVFLIVPALGWISLEAEQRGVFGDEVASALMVAASIAVLGLFIWVGASRAAQGEAHLDRMRRLYAALSRANQAITRVHDRAEILSGVCRTAVEQGGFRFAWIAWTSPDLSRFEAAAEAGAPPGYIGETLRELASPSPALAGALRMVQDRFEHDEPIFVNDVQSDPLAASRRASLQSIGVRSVALIPILVGGRLVAILFVYADQPNVFATEERELLREMGFDVGFALQTLDTQSRLASIVNSLNAGIWSVDPRNHAMIYVNPSFERIFGCSAAEFYTDRKLRFRDIHPDDRDRVESGFYATLAKTGSASFEYRLRRPDGEERWIQDRGWVVHEAEGVTRFDGIANDITDRRRIEEEIRRLNATLERRVAERTGQLENANRELNAFSYSVSHDLRAPLRAIEGFAALLEERIGARMEPEEAGYLQRIRRAVDRMAALIEGMLELARLTTQPLTYARVDLSAIARELADELQRETPPRRAQWQIAEGLVVSGDPSLLRAVMQNLVGNAWKFSSRVSDARIEVGSEALPGGKAIYVRDNGAGFDMAFADRLFDAFHRMHAEQEFPGTGIGLATVKRIVSRHGGRIWAQARPGAGATFFFTLGEAESADRNML